MNLLFIPFQINRVESKHLVNKLTILQELLQTNGEFLHWGGPGQLDKDLDNHSWMFVGMGVKTCLHTPDLWLSNGLGSWRLSKGHLLSQISGVVFFLFLSWHILICTPLLVGPVEKM